MAWYQGRSIVSKETSIESVQHRLDITCAADRHWRIMALTHSEWCIVAMSLPPDIVEDLEELQELRANQRGGTRVQRREAEDPTPYRLANNPDTIYYYQPETSDEVLAELICYVADQYGQSTDDVIVITRTGIPDLHERLRHYQDAHHCTLSSLRTCSTRTFMLDGYGQQNFSYRQLLDKEEKGRSQLTSASKDRECSFQGKSTFLCPSSPRNITPCAIGGRRRI